jgi:hypothetical protein
MAAGVPLETMLVLKQHVLVIYFVNNWFIHEKNISTHFIKMLPKNLQYQPKVESAPARRYRTNIQPQSGSTFSAGETIIINVPTRNNTALIASESVLKFTYNVTLGASTAVAAFESCGVHAAFNRLRVFHGSNLLQDIQNYGDLAKILTDFQMPLDAVQGRYSVTSGTSSDYAGTLVGVTAGDAITVKPVNRGRNYGTSGGASGAQTYTACINLISLLGSLAGGKYLPLWEMTAAPLRLELVVAGSGATAAVNSMCIGPNAPSAFSLSGVEYIGEFLELPDSAIAAIKAGSSSPLQMVIPDYRSYQFSQSLTNGTPTTISMPIPAKFSSLKSIFINQKNSGAINRGNNYPLSSGIMGLTQYQFRIGSEVLPSNPPTTVAEYFTETCKCFGSIADMDYQPAVDIESYSVVNPGVTVNTFNLGQVTNSGAFVVGIDCEAYQNADKASIFAGMNTNTSDIFFIGQYTPSADQTALLTAFANYDSVLVCENGVAYTRY